MTSDRRERALHERLRPLADYLRALEAPADLPTLERLLRGLSIAREHFGPACQFDEADYRRNLLLETPWCELVLVCWRPGQSTPIHDHKGSSCAFLVVEGEATERQYQLGPDGRLGPGQPAALRERGYVCASSEADIHEVRNEAGDDLITLHIYSPPLQNLNIYSRETGLPKSWAPAIAGE